MIAHVATVRWRSVPWRIVLLLSYVGINLVLIATKVVLDPDIPVDWQMFRMLPEAVADGTVYELDTPVPFGWSPVAAWIMAGAALLGYWPWVAIHVASVLLLRLPLLIGLILVSYGFWFDTAQGNTVTFFLVAGILALRGSRSASLIYLGMLLIVPRPLMAPLAAWLMWQRPDLRLPFAAMFIVHAALVVASGYALPWLETMVTYDLSPGITIGPTALLGRWWLLLGIPLAAWLTWRGHVGWAGIAASPYITPQYVIWPLLELSPKPVDGEEPRPV